MSPFFPLAERSVSQPAERLVRAPVNAHVSVALATQVDHPVADPVIDGSAIDILRRLSAVRADFAGQNQSRIVKSSSHDLHIHVRQYPRPILYAVRPRLVGSELQILDSTEAIEIAAQIDDPALGLRRVRTNRPTHHLIVQSQRKRRPRQYHRVELRVVEARRQHADIRDDLDSSRLEVGEDALALLFRRILRHDSRHTRQAVGNVPRLLHEPGEKQYAPTIHPKKPPNDAQHSVVEAHAPILALHGVVRIVGPGRVPAQPAQIDQRNAVVVQLGQIPLPEQVVDLHEEQQAREDARAGIRDKAQDRAVSRRIQTVRRSRQADDLAPDRLEKVAVHALLRIDHVALVYDHIPEVRELLDVVLHAADSGKGDTGDSLAIAGGRVDRAFEDVVCAELRVVLLQYLLARLEHQHRSAEPSGNVGNDQTLAAARRKNHNTVGRSGAVLEIPHRYVDSLLLIWTKPVHGLFFLKRFVAIVADLRRFRQIELDLVRNVVR